MRDLLILFSMLLWSVTARTDPQPFLVGNWYGEEQPDDPNVMWMAHFWPDGRFQAQFRVCKGKQQFDETDEGSWTYTNKIAEVTSNFVNGVHTHQVERYDTLSYDGHKHVYRHERTKFVFHAVRVDADFELPGCNLSS
jgi:hypothetical protein